MFHRALIVLLLALVLAVPAAQAQEAHTLRIMSTNPLTDMIASWRRVGGRAEVVGGGIREIVDAYNSQNDQVDLFFLISNDGLFDIKRTGFYMPLEDSSILLADAQELYPPYQQAIFDQGHLVGFIVQAEPWYWVVAIPSLLEEAGCVYPTTFDELLDVCEAVTEAGLTSPLISLFDDYPYTKAGMMDLFMPLYIRESQVNDGQVDFTQPAFIRVVDRIRKTVPDVGSIGSDGSIFYTIVASFYPTVQMLLPPRTQDGGEAALAGRIMLLFVNPYSQHREEAIRFLEHQAGSRSYSDYFLYQTLNEPVINPNNEKLKATASERLAVLEAKAELTGAEEQELRYHRATIERIERHPWLISAEDITWYQRLLERLYILEHSPVTYDSSLQALTARYLAGAYTAERFAEECQRHIRMIYLEYGIE